MILNQLSPQYAFPRLRYRHKRLGRGIRIIDKIHGQLYQEGEKVNQIYFLIEGRVALYKKNSEGYSIELAPVACGEFIGIQNIKNLEESSHSAKVCRPSRLLLIPTVQLPYFIKRWPAFKKHIIGQLIDHLDVLISC